ncbi:MAG: hypothetical protein ACOYJD_05165 [Christensenellales bacterium]
MSKQGKSQIGIGGYMEFERYTGREFHDSALRFNLARTAVAFAVKAGGVKRVLLPRYLCSSIGEALLKEGIASDYYRLKEDMTPDIDKHPNSGECVFIVNYFGRFNNDELEAMRRLYGNIFIDNTQSFFQPPLCGVDTVYSCRKYFGVPDGAYLYTKNTEAYEKLPPDYSRARLKHIFGRFEAGPEGYYQDFKRNELRLTEHGIRRMSELTQNMLKGIDYEIAMRKRSDNFNILDAALSDLNHLSVKNRAGLFMYPFMPDNPNETRLKLLANKIYIPTLWPEVEEGFEPETGFAKNILPLPIDQRYGKEEMERIIDILI